MANVKVLIFALAVLAIIGASFASAQIVPYVGVFSERAAWDPPPPGQPPPDNGFIGDGTAEHFTPPGVAGQVDSFYVIAYNLNCLVTGIEWQIVFPSAMTFITDIDTQPVLFGDSQAGAAMGWAIPQDGFQAINVATVIFQWNITSCGGPRKNLDVPVVGHPLFAPVPRNTCFNDPLIYDDVGLTALICATVPVEESTWGKVKALYKR